MKLPLGFIFTTLSLVSATASTTPPLYPDSSKQPSTSSGVLAAYADLVLNTFTTVKWESFCAILALHVPILVEKSYVLDAKLVVPLRTLKYISLLNQIQSGLRQFPKRPEMIVTNAKRSLIKCVYRLLNFWLPKFDFSTDQIHLAFQQIVRYMEWERVIFEFTQSSTSDKWKACLEEVIKKMENSTVSDLIKVFEKWMVECSNSTTFPTFNLNQLKDSVVFQMSSYVPSKIGFQTQKELVSFFLDYLFQINIAYPNASIQINSNGNYSICCQDCSAIHTTSSPPSTNCNVWNAIHRYSLDLRSAIKALSEVFYDDYENIFSESDNLADKLNIICESNSFLGMLDDAFSEIVLLSHPKYANSHIRLMFLNLAYQLFNVRPFSDYLIATESIYCALLKDKIDELKQLRICNYSSLSVRSGYFKKLIEAIPDHYHQVKVSDYIRHVTCYTTRLYRFSRFVFLICQKFHKYLMKEGEQITPKRRRLDDSINFEKCIDCHKRIGRNNPLVHPICSCYRSFIHVNCYLKKMIKEFFKCPRCEKLITTITELEKYIEDCDIFCVNSIKFRPLLPTTREILQRKSSSDDDESNDQDQQNSSLPAQPVAKVGIVKEKDWKSKCEDFKRNAKFRMIKMSMTYLKKSGESLKDLLARYDNDIPGFISLISPYYYEKVFPCTEAFLHNSVLPNDSSNDSDSEGAWKFFLKHYWNPFKELTESDILYIEYILKY